MSDHLLPLQGHDEAIAQAESAVSKIPSLIEINEQLNIWSSMARQWRDDPILHFSEVLFANDSGIILTMIMVLPRPLEKALECLLYWDEITTLKVSVLPEPSTQREQEHLPVIADSTALLLQSVFKTRMDPSQKDFVAHLVPPNVKDLGTWCENHSGATDAESIVEGRPLDDKIGVIIENGVPHIYSSAERLQPHCANDRLDGASHGIPDTVEDVLFIKAKRFPKRRDFLHSIPIQDRDNLRSSLKLLPASCCTVVCRFELHRLLYDFIIEVLASRNMILRLSSGT